jgi:lysophospholipase L1-like esterase
LTIRSREPDRRERLRSWGSLLCAASSLVVVTCAGARQGPVVPAVAPVVAPPSPGADPAPTASAGPEATALDASAPVVAGPLARFHASLAELERGARTEPVRVLWLGDSHTAADFWPDAVRRPLQARFGNAGPGFLYAGLRVYRHANVGIEDDGKWTRKPRSPSYWELQDDGIFGLGGMRTTPETAKSRVVLTLGSDLAKSLGRVRYDIAYRVDADSEALVLSVQGRTTNLDASLGELAEGGIRHYVFETDASDTVTVRGGKGRPELFGIIVEGTGPGVVLDTLGINGARVGTPVAWDHGAWVAEARRRAPTLAVLAYGTNEVGDAVAPWRYGALYDELLGRVRLAAPEVDCAIIGPTERMTADWVTHPRVSELEAVEREAAERLGCLYVSAVSEMGGPGSLKRWAEQSPPLASPDHVHLTPDGYKLLGASIARVLLEGYRGVEGVP